MTQTYKQKNRELRREIAELRGYKPMYFYVVGEVDKLRQLLEAIEENNTEKFGCILKEYQQLYGRYRR